jgi:antitoxin ParD1/3/4
MVIRPQSPKFKYKNQHLFTYQLLVHLIYKLIFMARNTSILLGGHYDEFIAKEVASGRYSSASEVIRSALRMLEDEEKKKKLLIKELVTGEKSPRVENFDPKAHLKKLHERLQ